MSKEMYLSEIEKRLSRHFSASRDGYKIPASERHRLEGFMQGAVFMDLVTNSELAELMEKVHFTVFEKSIAERKKENKSSWQESAIDYEKYDQPTHERRNS
jgi:hypothetical protein